MKFDAVLSSSLPRLVPPKPREGGCLSVSCAVCAVATFAVWLTLTSMASAMVVVPAEFSEMVAASELVVHGRLVRVRSQVTGDRRTIETLVTVSVVDTLKGDPGATVYFRVPGGQVGRYRRVMVGAPEFTEGEEVVLFLKGRPPVVPMPFGLSQGVYRVSRGGDGRGMVTPLMISAAPGRVVRGDPARRPLEISLFVRDIRAIVERQR
jgi:hypothetical protein